MHENGLDKFPKISEKRIIFCRNLKIYVTTSSNAEMSNWLYIV